MFSPQGRSNQVASSSYSEQRYGHVSTFNDLRLPVPNEGMAGPYHSWQGYGSSSDPELGHSARYASSTAMDMGMHGYDPTQPRTAPHPGMTPADLMVPARLQSIAAGATSGYRHAYGSGAVGTSSMTDPSAYQLISPSSTTVPPSIARHSYSHALPGTTRSADFRSSAPVDVASWNAVAYGSRYPPQPASYAIGPEDYSRHMTPSATTTNSDDSGGSEGSSSPHFDHRYIPTLDPAALRDPVEVSRPLVSSTAIRSASEARRNRGARFYCPLPGCGSDFTTKSNLQGHMRSHSGEKPYACAADGCGKAFTRQSDCRRHEEKLHPGLSPASTSRRRSNNVMVDYAYGRPLSDGGR